MIWLNNMGRIGSSMSWVEYGLLDLYCMKMYQKELNGSIWVRLFFTRPTHLTPLHDADSLYVIIQSNVTIKDIRTYVCTYIHMDLLENVGRNCYLYKEKRNLIFREITRFLIAKVIKTKMSSNGCLRKVCFLYRDESKSTLFFTMMIGRIYVVDYLTLRDQLISFQIMSTIESPLIKRNH